MARIEKTVFISYRRTDVYTALAVYENLKNQGYDVFFDYRSVSSGDFEQIITSNIRARAHFLIILTPTALDRCNEPGDWLRREIELAIDEKRNIVPLFFKGFRFGTPEVSKQLTGKLQSISRYNGLNVHEDYFDEAMQRVRAQFLSVPLNTILHPVSTEVQKVVKAEQVAADQALEKIEDVKELAKQVEDKSKAGLAPKPVPVVVPQKQQWEEKQKLEKKLQPNPVANISRLVAKQGVTNAPMKRLMARIAGGLLLISLCVWGGWIIFNNIVNGPAASTNTPSEDLFSLPTSDSMYLISELATQTAIARGTNTPSMSMATLEVLATQSAIAQSTPTHLSAMISDKDGMTLLHVPAGEFTIGSENGESDEKPVHTLDLDAFWIDQTEVTNAMYAKCVADGGACNEPANKSSYSRSSYYGNPEFANYPVIYVDWNMAKTYCEWAGRRLPTEAEWEKAARGTDGRIYPRDENISCSLANYWGKDGGCAGDTVEVGSYPEGASPYDAFDMAGSVWEWVSSLYQPYPYDATDGRESLTSSDSRVLRGGSWDVIDLNVRSANRNRSIATDAYFSFGFRCASSP